MHAYLHNIKTFNNATRHLTRVERSLYRDATELYYDTEQPLPADDFDKLARRLLAHTDEEKAALRYVLDEFFVRTGDVYTHDYCDALIEKYQGNSTAKANAGKASAAKRKKKADARKQQRQANGEQKSTPVEQMLDTCSTLAANHEPLTINHEPLTSNREMPVDSGESPPPATADESTGESKRNKPKRPIPNDFTVTREMLAWVQESNYGHIQILSETDRFIDHWKSKGEARADWVASWRTWIRNADRFQREAAGGRSQRDQVSAAIHGGG